MVLIMSFGKTLGNLVQMYTLLETSVGAVNRLKSFSDNTSAEDLPGEDFQPPPAWPDRGIIEVRGVSASYRQVFPLQASHYAIDGVLMVSYAVIQSLWLSQGPRLRSRRRTLHFETSP